MDGVVTQALINGTPGLGARHPAIGRTDPEGTLLCGGLYITHIHRHSNGSITGKSPADRNELQEVDADAVSCYVRVDLCTRVSRGFSRGLLVLGSGIANQRKGCRLGGGSDPA